MPRSEKGVRAFLRFVNYYKAFINKFITTIAFLTVLTGKHLFFWTLEA